MGKSAHAPLFRQLLKAKIHRATVTHADLHYEGSLTLDPTLLEAADMLPHEAVHVWNVSNGARFETYVIPGESGSGIVCVNGAAARLACPGDIIIITTFCWIEEAAARCFSPCIIQVDANNKPC